MSENRDELFKKIIDKVAGKDDAGSYAFSSNGMLISGIPITFEEYINILSGSIVDKNISEKALEMAQLDKYVHFKDVTIAISDQHINCEAWRCRLDSVDGFTSGSLKKNETEQIYHLTNTLK